MKIKELVLASIAVTTFAAVTIAITQTGKEPVTFNKAAATEKSFTFNENVGKTYWNSDITDTKYIASTPEHDAIFAKANEVHRQPDYSFGKEKSFFWNDYSINENGQDTKITLAVGVNNLQSFSFTFHLNVDEGKQSRTSYAATLNFFGEAYDVDKCITNPESKDRLYDEVTYSKNGVVKDEKYTHTWLKSEQIDQSPVIRYVLFELKIFSTAGTCDSYCALFLENISVTWSC